MTIKKIAFLIICLFVTSFNWNQVFAAKYYKCKVQMPLNGARRINANYTWSADVIEGPISDCDNVYDCKSDAETCRRLYPLFNRAYESCVKNKKIAQQAHREGNCKVFYK